MKTRISPIHFAEFIPPVETIDAKEWSFWSLVDLTAAHRHGIPQFIRKHNSDLPSHKGRIRSGGSAVAKSLLYLASKQMEERREVSPIDYDYYLSDKIDCIPVITNFSELQKMLHDCYTKGTISSYIKLLIKCGIIKRKLRSSRNVKPTKSKSLNPNSTTSASSKKRGDMILFINKEIFFWVKRVSKNRQC